MMGGVVILKMGLVKKSTVLVAVRRIVLSGGDFFLTKLK
jgi:hypothetical protein